MINNATTVIQVVVGDMNYDLNFTLQDSDGNAINITGATLAFKMQLLSDLAVQTTGAMTIVNPALGTCKYSVKVQDFAVAGVYDCQIVLSFTNVNEQITFDNIQVTAEARVPE